VVQGAFKFYAERSGHIEQLPTAVACVNSLFVM